MSGTGFTDRMDSGYWPLQDHEEGVPLEIRQSMGAGRVRRLKDPDEGSDPTDSLLEYAIEDNMGTLGDIHPWLFIQTRDRGERGMGTWNPVYASISVDGSAGPPPGRTGQPAQPTGVLPMRTSAHGADGRMKTQVPGWPACFPRVPKGTDMVLLPGMEERRQETVMLHADPRLVAVNAAGPGDCGTLVVDLQPDMEPCMNANGPPGMLGRAARLQSFLRVIPLGQSGSGALGAGPGNALAWSLTTSEQDAITGYGMCYAKLDKIGKKKGPITGGAGNTPIKGPITGVAGPNIGKRYDKGKWTTGSVAGGGGNQMAMWGGGGNGNGNGDAMAQGSGRHDEDGSTPCSFGKFNASPRTTHGIGFMAYVGASGPFTVGADPDKHEIGRDKDGHAMNAGHLSYNAYFFRDSLKDGPLHFEDGKYPNPKTVPFRSKVHLVWDDGLSHEFVKGTRRGKWRWYAEFDMVVPSNKETPPVTSVPVITGSGSSPTPGGPSTPAPGSGLPGDRTSSGPITPGDVTPRGRVISDE